MTRSLFEEGERQVERSRIGLRCAARIAHAIRFVARTSGAAWHDLRSRLQRRSGSGAALARRVRRRERGARGAAASGRIADHASSDSRSRRHGRSQATSSNSQPLLPDEEAALDEQVQALASFCQGFSSGLGLARRHRARRARPRRFWPTLARSAVQRLTAEDGENRDQADFALAELTEYVRVSVQIVYEELARRAQSRGARLMSDGVQTTRSTVNPREFARRRKHLMDLIGANGIAVLTAAPERIRSRDTLFTYRPDSDFYYLTGFPEPEGVAVLDAGPGAGEFLIFCRERNPERELWDGPRAGPKARSKTTARTTRFRSPTSTTSCPGCSSAATASTTPSASRRSSISGCSLG